MSRAAPGADVDMRGFQYELEPLHNRRQWQLDAAQARLVQARQAENEMRAGLEELQALQEREAGLATRALTARLDAAMHRHTLGYLAQLQERAVQLRAQLHGLQAQREEAQAACAHAQRQVELMLAHRDEAVAAYAADALRRQSMEADRDWLARSQRPGAEARS